MLPHCGVVGPMALTAARPAHRPRGHAPGPFPARRRAEHLARIAPLPSPVPLGSLTQSGARGAANCLACGSDRVTWICDGRSPTAPRCDFTHCLDCEHRSWQDGEDVLSVDHVLAKAQRTR